MDTTKKGLPDIPMFRDYSLGQLIEKLPYSEMYLISLKHGYQLPTAMFRRVTAAVLGKSEIELFGPTRLDD